MASANYKNFQICQFNFGTDCTVEDEKEQNLAEIRPRVLEHFKKLVQYTHFIISIDN